MGSTTKTYFLLPTFDLPASGPLLASPFFPSSILSAPLPTLPLPKTYTSTKTSVEITDDRDISTRVGIFAKFLDLVVGVGADVGVKLGHKAGVTYGVERLDTEFLSWV